MELKIWLNDAQKYSFDGTYPQNAEQIFRSGFLTLFDFSYFHKTEPITVTQANRSIGFFMIDRLSRETLHQRHRLSHQQIDEVLDENSGQVNLEEKLDQLKKLSHFVEISKIFEENRIWFLVTKGPVLSQRMYGDPAVRRWKDIDLLVDPDNVTKSVKLLYEMGYEPDNMPWPDSKKRQKMMLHFGKNVEMYHRQKGFSVELHWKLFADRLIDTKREWNLIRQHSETTALSGARFHRFSNEFELLYLVIHGGMHGWFRLKWLLDIRDYTRAVPVDKNRFMELCEQYNAGRFVCLCNGVMNEWFPGTEPLPAPKTDCQYQVEYSIREIKDPDAGLSKGFFDTVQKLRFNMSLSPRIRYKLDVLRLITFYRPDLEQKWIPPYPLFFYLFRPFGLIFRKLRK